MKSIFAFLASATLLVSSSPAQTSNRDSDQDGLPDEWEIANGFDYLSRADANADADGDGHSNLLEYILGGNPRAAADALRMSGGTSLDGRFTVTVTERPLVPGMKRQVERAASLAAPINWTTNEVSVVATGNEVVLRSEVPMAEAPAQFFRIAYELPSAPPANILLHSTLESAAAVTTPRIGLGGASTIGAFVAGQLGNAAQFTAASDLARFPTTTGPAQNLRLDRGEIEFLYRPNYNAGSEDDSVHALVIVGDLFNAPHIRLTESDRLTFSITTPLWETIVAAGGYHEPLWQSGQWVRIRATWDSSNPTNSIQLFVNEVRVDSGTVPGGWSAGDYASLQTIYLGAANDSGAFSADGLIDDFFIRDASSGEGTIATGGNGGGGGDGGGGGGGGDGENGAPVIEAPVTQTTTPGTQLRFTIRATSPTGGALAYRLLPGAPEGAILSAATGEFTWTPGANLAGRAFRIGFEVANGATPPLVSAGSVTVVVVDPAASGIFDPTVVLQPATIARQPVGVPFVDPVFGTTLRRVSNTSDTGGYETQIYNQLQAFSTDDQYILLATSGDYLIRRVSDFSAVQGINTSPWNCPRWHPRRPHTIVHYDSNEDTTVRVQFTDVETLVTSNAFVFPAQYQRILGNQSFDELSHDGRWMAGFLTRGDGVRVIFTLDLENGRLAVEKPLDTMYAGECAPDPVFGMMEPDWVGVSPLGRYLVVQWQRSAVTPCSGLICYTIDTGEFRGRIQDNTRHGDLGLDFDGVTEVFMTTELFSPWDSNRPSSIYRVLPGTPTVAENVFLQPLDWSSEDHYSMQGPNGVGLVSWGRTGDVNDYAFDGELFIQNTDGSVRRLVHHRSTQCGYWVQIRATMSRSGRYVIFASDWGRGLDCPGPDNPGGVGAGDPYIIDLSIPRP